MNNKEHGCTEIRRFILLISFCAVFSQAALCAEDPQPTAQDMDRLISDLSVLIAQNPSDSVSLYRRGTALFLTREYQKAMTDLDRAIELSPYAGDFYLMRGKLYYQISQFDKAIADLTEALELDAEVQAVEKYFWRGESFFKKDRIDAALGDYERCLKIDPQFQWAMVGRADCYRKKGDLKRALIEIDNAMKINPDFLPGLMVRAKIYMDTGKLQEAYDSAQKALKVSQDPQDFGPSLLLARIHKAKGETELCKKELLAAVEKGMPLTPAIKEEFGFWEKERKGVIQVSSPEELAQAIENIAQKYAPRTSLSELEREMLAYTTSKNPSVQPSDGTMIALEFADAEGHKNLHTFPVKDIYPFQQRLFEKKRFDLLNQFCRKVTEQQPRPLDFVFLAESLYAQGKIDEAIAVYQETLVKFPETAKIGILVNFMLWGVYQFDKADPQQAEVHTARFRQVLDAMSEQDRQETLDAVRSVVFFFGSQYLNEIQDFAKAIKYFSMAVEIAPHHDRSRLNLIISRFNMNAAEHDVQKADELIQEAVKVAGESKDRAIRDFVDSWISDILTEAKGEKVEFKAEYTEEAIK